MRVLQGLGALAGSVVTVAIVRDLFTGRPAAALLSRLMLVLGAAPVLAPTLGGGVLRWTSWRGVFGVLALVSLVLIAVAARWLPETLPPRPAPQPGRRRHRPDLRGAAPRPCVRRAGARRGHGGRRGAARHRRDRHRRAAGRARADVGVLAAVGLALPNAPALALGRHGAVAGTAAALLGAVQFGVGALVSPVVGVLGSDSVAMAVVVAGGMAVALAVLLAVVRPWQLPDDDASATA